MKDAFYFPHDCNAIQDPKMMTLLVECGLAGVGFFWILIEILHQQEWGAIGGPLVDQYLAFYGKQGSWNETTLSKIKSVLFDTKLLILTENGMVTSERVQQNKQNIKELKEKGRQNALKRWGANGVPMASQCDPNALNESKVKESIKDICQPDQKTVGPTATHLLSLWNKQAHSNLPRAKLLTETRKRHANARLIEHPEQIFWEDVITRINNSPLLRGEKGDWKASFDWMLNPTNLTKIIEGNYDRNGR